MRVVSLTRTTRSPGDRILKVDHAGEHGAVWVYGGQIAVARITCPSLVPQLEAFRQHERRHRAVFRDELRRRGVKRCRSDWLCAAGGLVLGVVTGLMGRGAILATTVAIERVVLEHLRDQMQELGACDRAAFLAIASIVSDETLHLDESAHQMGVGSHWSRMLVPVVSASTEFVIWMGMRL